VAPVRAPSVALGSTTYGKSNVGSWRSGYAATSGVTASLCALYRTSACSLVTNALRVSLRVAPAWGSRWNRSVARATAYGETLRSARTSAGPVAAMPLMAISADTPTGSVAGSGMPTGTPCAVGPTSADHGTCLPGQPNCAATGSVSARTTGELAIEVPVAGAWNAPSDRARRSQNVDSGTQASGSTSAGGLASTSAMLAESRDSTSTS
jgi:hypothetical protein